MLRSMPRSPFAKAMWASRPVLLQTRMETPSRNGGGREAKIAGDQYSGVSQHPGVLCLDACFSQQSHSGVSCLAGSRHRISVSSVGLLALAEMAEAAEASASLATLDSDGVFLFLGTVDRDDLDLGLDALGLLPLDIIVTVIKKMNVYLIFVVPFRLVST